VKSIDYFQDIPITAAAKKSIVCYR